MRDHGHDAQRDGAQGQPPQKAKPAGEQNPAHKQTDGHAARPDILRDERIAHPANAEPLAELLSQLQQSHGNAYVQLALERAGGAKAQALDDGTKGELGTAFGEDFEDVRVHTGKDARDAAEHLGARAFTHGRDIYFNEGEYNPSTREGKELLAHELAHVAQQRGGARGAQAHTVGAAGDTFEREAHEAAAAVLGGARHPVRGRADAPAIQREEKPKEPGAPVIKSHPQVITHDKGSGTIDADGRFSVAYAYTVVNKAPRVPLTLAVPDGVAVTVTPLSSISASDYTLQNIEGLTARAAVISASTQRSSPAAFQVAFTKGTYTYVAVFQFPATAPPKAAAPKRPSPPEEPDPVVEIQR